MYKICIVTATRAEYGLFKNVIRCIEKDDDLELCLIVTGTHLSESYGMTVSEIEDDGIEIADRMYILDDCITISGVANTISNASREFSKIVEKHKPEMLVVIGDRYELLPIASIAVLYHIPIAHIAGGETTEGAIDECVRHCLTKMSYLHFPACELYKHRIIQMGENPARVYNVGDVGVENIKKMSFMNKEELENSLGILLDKPFYSVTYHPVTQEADQVRIQMDNVLDAISELSSDNIFIFTKANADVGGAYINRRLEEFVRDNSNCYLFASLGARRYLSLLNLANGVVGNSSSGIIEAPVFKIPTINIGNRQRGRLQAKSIVNCAPEKNSIIEAFDTIASEKFQSSLKNIVNPYDGDNSAEQIVYYIKKAFVDGIDLEKSFYDVDFDK